MAPAREAAWRHPAPVERERERVAEPACAPQRRGRRLGPCQPMDTRRVGCEQAPSLPNTHPTQLTHPPFPPNPTDRREGSSRLRPRPRGCCPRPCVSPPPTHTPLPRMGAPAVGAQPASPPPPMPWRIKFPVLLPLLAALVPLPTTASFLPRQPTAAFGYAAPPSSFYPPGSMEGKSKQASA